MRKSEYIKQQATSTPKRVLKDEFLPEIKKVWKQYGYDSDYLLDENDNFYNVLEDFFMSKDELQAAQKRCSFATSDYCFERNNDVKLYRQLFDLARMSLCGFYYVKKHRYFKASEVHPYAEWYLDLMDRGKHYFMLDSSEDKDSEGYIYFEEKYETLCNKYSALFNNIAALLIAIDVTQYLEEKKICDKHITKNNVDKFLQYGPRAGYIFDAEEMKYRKPKDFKEFTHHLHTRYWFHDASKGYHIDAPYKWSPEIPLPEQLLG